MRWYQCIPNVECSSDTEYMLPILYIIILSCEYWDIGGMNWINSTYRMYVGGVRLGFSCCHGSGHNAYCKMYIEKCIMHKVINIAPLNRAQLACWQVTLSQYISVVVILKVRRAAAFWGGGGLVARPNVGAVNSQI